MQTGDRPAEQDAGVDPLRLFLSGTFTFPLRLGVLPQTLELCFIAAALFAAVRLGSWCAAADSQEIDKATRVLLWNGLALSITCGALASLAWAYAASAYGMTILRDTACGAEATRDWPNLLALEDAGQWLYVFNALFFAVLPAALAAKSWSRIGVPMPWAIGGSIAILFPILLLSMLAANSPLHLLSSRVLRSLLGQGLAWVGFYVTTFVAGLAVAALEIALWRHAGWVADVAVTAVVAAIGWMVYFRLLGRLALLLHSHLGG